MLFKRKKKTDDTQLHIESIPDESTKGFNVVEICEQMVDAARELEDNRTEYALVTNYLTDIERMENMSETDKKTMNDAAANILTLEKTRSDFLKTKNRISDSQYAQMQQLEDEIPRAIKRLEKNESSLDVINKDLRYLEGEKVQFDIDGEYAKSRQRAFRVYAVLLVVFFAIVVAVCTLMQIVYGADTTIFMLIGALLSAVAGSFVLLTYQSYSDEVKSAAASKNKAVALENRVKIKYVSIKNAVDYTYEKYHVKNSKEFVYNYEQYLLAVKDKERFRRTNEDLEYNSKKLVSVLSKNDFYDARVWLNYTNAIVDHKLTTTSTGSVANIDENGVVKFKGFLIEEVPDDLFQTGEVAYVYIDGVGKAFTGINTARTIESEDFDGVALQGAGKAGEFILPDNKKAVCKVLLNSEYGLDNLTVTSAASSTTSGKTKLTIYPALTSGNSYKYKA